MELTKDEIQAALDEEVNKIVKKYGAGIKLSLINLIGLIKLQVEKEEYKLKEVDIPRLIPLVKWNDYHPDPSVKALRMLVFRKDNNGFDKVIVRRGNRILINEKEFFEWQKRELFKPLV